MFLERFDVGRRLNDSLRRRRAREERPLKSAQACGDGGSRVGVALGAFLTATVFVMPCFLRVVLCGVHTAIIPIHGFLRKIFGQVKGLPKKFTDISLILPTEEE